jgi:hypothetical protein
MERPIETNVQLVPKNYFNAKNTGANPEPEIQTNAKNITQEDSKQREGPNETNAQLAKLISGDRRTMALEERVNRAAPNITRIIQILKQIINEKYKEGEASDLKVSSKKNA